MRLSGTDEVELKDSEKNDKFRKLKCKLKIIDW